MPKTQMQAIFKDPADEINLCVFIFLCLNQSLQLSQGIWASYVTPLMVDAQWLRESSR